MKSAEISGSDKKKMIKKEEYFILNHTNQSNQWKSVVQTRRMMRKKNILFLSYKSNKSVEISGSDIFSHK